MSAYIPYVPSNRPDGIAELLAERGKIAGDAANRIGQNWANALQGIGQTVGQTVARIPQERLDAARAQREETMAKAQAATMQRQQQDQTALDNVDWTQKREDILAQLPGHLREHALDHFAKLDELGARMDEHKAKLQADHADYMARGAMGVLPFLDGPDGGKSALGVFFQQAVHNGAMTPEEAQQHAQQLQDASPDRVKQIAHSLIAQSPNVSKEFREANKPTNVAPGSSLVDPMTGKTIYTAPEKAANLEHIETADGIQTFDPKTGRLGPVIAKGKSENDASLNLTPAGLDAAATTYAKTGVVAALGNGKASTKDKSAIINRAAEMFPGLDVASNKAGFTADEGALKNLQKQTDTVAAFESTANKNAELLKDIAKRVPDLGSKLLNRPVRTLKGALGDEDMAAFNAIRQSVQNEYARLISNPGLAGTMSDSARKEGEAVLSPGATVGQILSALKTLQAESHNRRVSYETQLGEIKGRIGSGRKPAAGGNSGGGTQIGRFHVEVE